MATICEYISQLNSDDQMEVFEGTRHLTEMAAKATAAGREVEKAAMAAELANHLNGRTESKKDDKGKEIPGQYMYSSAARIRISRLLGCVGGRSEVPALVEAMNDLDVREAARMALELNPAREAGEALIKALDSVGPEYRIGVVNSLGKRAGDEAALAALKQVAAADAELPVQLAAADALAAFPDPANDPILAKLMQSADPAVKNRAARARLRLAGTLQKAGKGDAARDIYKAVQSSDAEKAQKKAAEIGLKR